MTVAMTAIPAVPAVTAQLSSPTDWAGFRSLARHLVAQAMPPQQVQWRVAGALQDGLFDDAAVLCASQLPAAPPLGLPAGFAKVAATVVLHDDAARFDRLYRWVWQLAADPALWLDTLLPQRVQLERMAQAVRREIHKMHAFVRFTPVLGAAGQTQHIAWFTPAHHVVVAAAPFFRGRFANLRWAILTPRCCVNWDGVQLRVSPGADPSQRPAADAGQALWLAYYSATFNPARLNLTMLQKEMPQRYWPNLPEAQLIAPLAAAAAQRTHGMLAAPPSQRQRRAGRPAQPMTTSTTPPPTPPPTGPTPAAAPGPAGKPGRG